MSDNSLIKKRGLEDFLSSDEGKKIDIETRGYIMFCNVFDKVTRKSLYLTRSAAYWFLSELEGIYDRYVKRKK